MKQDFILGKLAQIMAWENEAARVEFRWLRLMAGMKYDGYQDFLAGARFVESLADWLQQFTELEERRAAYAFVRESLVYLSTAEMNHLVELFYPETVVRSLQESVAQRQKIPTWQTWATAESRSLFERTRRQTLFIELSDGARIDVFRRANSGLISNEQALTSPIFNEEKWGGLLKDLRKNLNDPEARFAFVFLIDDFVGSGTTLLRKKDGSWKGKLMRFWEDMHDKMDTYFEPGWSLYVHHYLATDRAKTVVQERNAQILAERGDAQWFSNVRFTFGATLPADLTIRPETHQAFIALTDKYYDKSIENDHTREGGTDAKLGFGQCALPLVLEHNTPNNAVSLLWADTEGKDGQHAMRPLFRRRQRLV